MARYRRAELAHSQELKMATTQKSVFNLDTFEDVTLFKEFEPCKAPETVEEATAAVGGDTKKLLSLIHAGLISEQSRVLREDASGWSVKGEDGNLAPFSGTIANQDAVNAVVLTLAKTIFGYNKDLPLEARNAAKAAATAMIKSNEQMKEGLKKSAALSTE